MKTLLAITLCLHCCTAIPVPSEDMSPLEFTTAVLNLPNGPPIHVESPTTRH